MKISSKAVLYSAFVCPGAGYFLLKRKRRGYVFVGGVAFCLTFVLYDAFYKANIMANNLVQKLSHNGVLEPAALLQVLPTLPAYVHKQMWQLQSPLPVSVVVGLSIIFGLLWLVSMVDCWRLGRALER